MHRVSKACCTPEQAEILTEWINRFSATQCRRNYDSRSMITFKSAATNCGYNGVGYRGGHSVSVQMPDSNSDCGRGVARNGAQPINVVDLHSKKDLANSFHLVSSEGL